MKLYLQSDGSFFFKGCCPREVSIRVWAGTDPYACLWKWHSMSVSSHIHLRHLDCMVRVLDMTLEIGK